MDQWVCFWGVVSPLVGWLGANAATLILAATLAVTAWQAGNAARQVKFGAEQIRQSRAANEAAVASQVTARSADLQWRILLNSNLRPLLTGGETATAAQQRQVVAGLVINHFATLFALHQIHGIPDEIWNPLVIDMRQTLSRPDFRTRWETLREYHDAGFQHFVDSLSSGETTQTNEE